MTKSVKPASWLSWLKQLAVGIGALGTIDLHRRSTSARSMLAARRS